MKKIFEKLRIWRENGGVIPKISIFLCILAVLFLINGLGSLSGRTDYIKSKIQDEEIRLTSLGTIEENEAKIKQLEADLKKLNKEAEDLEKDPAYQQAKVALSEVCTRSYYSRYYCEDNCKELHDAVDAFKDKISDKKSKINSTNNSIESAKSNIIDVKICEDNIKELNKDLTEKIIDIIIYVISLLMAIIALILLAAVLALKKYDKLALIACAIMILSNILYIFCGYGSIRYLLNIIAFGMLALIFSGKVPQKGLLRNVMLTAVLLMALGVFLRFYFGLFFLLIILYMIALIIVGYILVPAKPINIKFNEYIPIAKFILAFLFTLFIWPLIWIYQVTKNLNKVEKNIYRTPGKELLCCIFIPFYFIYWTYKTASCVENYGAENGIELKLEILCLALMVVCPLMSLVVIQDKINLISKTREFNQTL